MPRGCAPDPFARKTPRDPMPPGLSTRVPHEPVPPGPREGSRLTWDPQHALGPQRRDPRRQGPQNQVEELAGLHRRRCLAPPASESQSRDPRPMTRPPRARPPARSAPHRAPRRRSPERAPGTQTSPPQAAAAASRAAMLAACSGGRHLVAHVTGRTAPPPRRKGEGAAQGSAGEDARRREWAPAPWLTLPHQGAHKRIPQGRRSATPPCPRKTVSGASSPDTTENDRARGLMHEDLCKNEPSFPWLPAPPSLQPGAVFLPLFQLRAAFLPSHAAQRPGAAGAVRNTCVLAMVMTQASCPAPGRSGPVYAN
ncbi:proline-rich protein 2-like [Myotis daubentonii]|uniref:proline-rich protein 2-like n=1 Tax=Myotis daubentonii TaxID=98922 RepID=UPI002872D0D5|nr:proline-rich protein 2-like [Myotis daubentonii]